MQSRETIERDFADQRAGIQRNSKGQVRGQIGKPQKLNAAQAATIFECQVQMLAAQRLIDRILDEAGVKKSRGVRSFVLMHVWRDRGRAGILRKNSVMHPSQTPADAPSIKRSPA